MIHVRTLHLPKKLAGATAKKTSLLCTIKGLVTNMLMGFHHLCNVVCCWPSGDLVSTCINRKSSQLSLYIFTHYNIKSKCLPKSTAAPLCRISPPCKSFIHPKVLPRFLTMIVVVRDDDALDDRPSTPHNHTFLTSDGSPMSDVSTASTSK